MITGFASMETAIQAVKFGAYDFLQKPFKLAEIEAVLDRALDHAAVLGQLQRLPGGPGAPGAGPGPGAQAVPRGVLKLNDLLVASQREVAEGPLVEPFLAHLRARFDPDAVPGPAAHRRGTAGSCSSGLRPWTARTPAPLPAPSALAAPLEWAWRDGLPRRAT